MPPHSAQVLHYSAQVLHSAQVEYVLQGNFVQTAEGNSLGIGKKGSSNS